jgi:hypothetical protein
MGMDQLHGTALPRAFPAATFHPEPDGHIVRSWKLGRIGGSQQPGGFWSVDRVEVEEEWGRWAVTFPDTALFNWTRWDSLAAELTMQELIKYGNVWVVEFPSMAGKKTGGRYKPEHRREVGEALAHLTALARVRGPGPLTREDWKKHDAQLKGEGR